MAKKIHAVAADYNGIGRHDSALSLTSSSSLRKNGHSLKEKLAEMETFFGPWAKIAVLKEDVMGADHEQAQRFKVSVSALL